MCDVDNAGDRGMRRSEDGSEQSSEEGREGKHADAPHKEKMADPRPPSEEPHSGESQPQPPKPAVALVTYDGLTASRRRQQQRGHLRVQSP